jgi:polyhydroxybutyrate depolymerase
MSPSRTLRSFTASTQIIRLAVMTQVQCAFWLWRGPFRGVFVKTSVMKHDLPRAATQEDKGFERFVTKRRKTVATVLGLLMMTGAASADCGAEVGACQLPGGTYHIALPVGVEGPIPATLLLHGHGGEGRDMIRDRVVSEITGLGYAVVAPDGQPRVNGGGRTWDFHPDRPATRDETAFLIAVAENATARFGLRRDRMLLAGFSIGGSMTSYLACAHPRSFAAYAPIAGSFWRPHPDHCAGPVRLFHTHGKADRTVPLEGREIRPGFAQGNVFNAMGIWRAANGCPSDKPNTTRGLGIFTIEDWTRCTPGASLSFALHDGGHGIPENWAPMAIDWFESLP